MNGPKQIDLANLFFRNYIKYDRLYEMSQYAFHGNPKNMAEMVDIYIDIYSLIKSLYTRFSTLHIDDSYALASCIINLGIHLRAYFQTRHGVQSRIYLVYGGARPAESISRIPEYNQANIIMEDSNSYLKSLVHDNLIVVDILSKYLYDIYYLVDFEEEFTTIVKAIASNETYNIIYSKEPLAYQLVAYLPRTFLYRPKKIKNNDGSWVVTKSTLYNAYRNGEMSLKRILNTSVKVSYFNIYQVMSGLRTRRIPHTHNANTSLQLLDTAYKNNILQATSTSLFDIVNTSPNIYDILSTECQSIHDVIVNRHIAIDIVSQAMRFSTTPSYRACMSAKNVNLYSPDDVRIINNQYFQKYPIDLNRV